MSSDFTNEPLTDFSQDENRRAMAQAIASVAEQLGQSYPNIIGDERVEKTEKLTSINPSDPNDVDYVVRISIPMADAAIIDPFGIFRNGNLEAEVTMRQESG